MERPERYDPEDLEHLMLERGFDELLEEERAYALRHLESRAEYERMRALLHHVRDTKSTQAPMDADPVVRERVLAAFREQRRPQWQIWLNSVGGFLLPARPSSYWRPALALGTVAVLIFGSLSVWNAMTPDNEMVLAEVKQETPAPVTLKPSEPVQRVEEPEQLNTVTQDETAAEASRTTIRSEAADEKRLEPKRFAEAADKMDMEDSPMMELQEDQVRSLSKPEAPTREMADVTNTSTGEISAPASTMATEVARSQNRSTGKVVPNARSGAAVADDRVIASVPAYSEDELLGLLRAAW
ncbi:MAG: hypothetical protein WA937_03655 [Flavobacteriales bacterium]